MLATFVNCEINPGNFVQKFCKESIYCNDKYVLEKDGASKGSAGEDGTS
jgi:hypothetical protein